MSTSDGKKSKRRKSKKSEDGSSSSSTTVTATAAATSKVEMKASSNILPKNNVGNNISNVENEHCEMTSKVEQLVDITNDPLPSVTIPQGSNPYFSGNKCLVCQKDKTSDATTSSPDSCDHLDTFPLGHFSRLPLWICTECRCSIEDDHNQKSGYQTSQAGNISLQDPLDSVLSSINSGRTSPFDITVNGAPCCCKTCHERREAENGQERDMLYLHQSWTELRWAIRQIYQDEGLGITDTKENENISSVENLEEVVHRLCAWDSHQFFLWLESYGRELVIEIKLNLLKYLGNGFKSSQQAKLFVAFMLEYYAKLCSACKKLRPVLKELEHGHLKKFNLNWELVIRHLFQSMVYGDHRIQNALPSLITQLRLIRSNDENVQKQLTALLQKYIQFNEEMMIVAVIWREAEPLIQEFNMDLATLKSKQKIHREEWDLAKKVQHRMSEPDLKKADVLVHRCKCEDCFKKNVCHPTFHQSSDSCSLPADLDLSDTSINGFCVTANFTNGLPESLDALSDPKEQCHGTTVLENGHSEGLKTLLDDDLWMCSLTHGRDCQSCKCLRDFVASKNGSEESKDAVLSHKKDCDDDGGNCTQSGGGSGHVNGAGLHSCQCHVNNLAPASVGSSNCSGNSNLVVADLPTIDVPCECHACVQNSDSATFPAIFNVLPPRPAALQLYPHIHGPNTVGHLSHNTAAHSLKPFLNTHLNGVHLPSVAPRLKLGTTDHHDSSTITTHPLVQDHSPVIHGYTDWENPFDSSKVLLNSRKYGDFFPPPVHRHHYHHPHLSDSSLESVVEGCSRQNDGIGFSSNCLPSLGTVLSSASSLPSISVPTSLSDTELVIKNGSAGLPTPTHFNKATQVVASNTGCMQQLPTIGHCAHGCHHAKQHSCDSDLTRSCVDDVANCNEGEATRVNARSSVCNVGNGKVSAQYHSCAGTNSHVPQQCCGPASKRLCDGIVEPRNNLSSAQSPPNSSSLCSSQDVDNFPCDLEESVDDSCSEQSSSTSMSIQKDGKHCDCCYCEVFGHDVATLAPVSRNYPEMRDKLRLRLNKKKMECMNEANVIVTKKDWPREDRRNLDDLISFINGGAQDSNDGDPSGKSAKALKKATKKLKKVEAKLRDDIKKTSGKAEECEENVSLTLQCEDVQDTSEESVMPDGLQMICDRQIIERLTNSKSSGLSSSLICEPKVKGDNFQKKEVNVESKSSSKGKKGAVQKSSAETTNNCQESGLSSENHQPASSSGTSAKLSDSCDLWEMLNGQCNSLDKASRKKRKASLPNTPASSSSGSVVSSSQNSSKASPSTQRHAKTTNGVQQNVVTCVPPQNKNSSQPRASSTDRFKCSATVTPVVNGEKAVKMQTKCTVTKQAQLENICCNGTEKLPQKHSQTPATSKTNKELLQRNGIRKVCSEDSIVSASKVCQPKEEKRKVDVSPQLRTPPVAASQPLAPNREAGNSCLGPNRKVQNESGSLKDTVKLSRRGKRQQGTSSAPRAIDDIFVPRDIDLDNGELDETERELEAFKRFCWNSVPVANKEKVHVNVKDMVRKKNEPEVPLNQPKSSHRMSLLIKSS